MAASPGDQLIARRRLADELRRRRLVSGLSTHELARRLGVGQSSISRYENGERAPSVADVRRWGEETGATLEELQGLALDAERALTEAVAWRGVMRGGLPRKQQEVAALEYVAGVVRIYHPVLVPGLLQTADYARRVFETGWPDGRPDFASAVAARVERQAVLYDTSKRFEFLVTEAALRWRFAPPAVQAAQLDRIRTMATLPNITIGIVPLIADDMPWHSHGFSMYDDRIDGGDPLVQVETLTAGVNVSDHADVDEYRQAFARLLRAADRGAGATERLADLLAKLTGERDDPI
jgi:transcriptional regulator with XRE-family HTH domain